MAKARKLTTGMKSMKKHGVAWWKKKVWTKAFSPYIRLRDALETTGSPHTLKCCSCGKPYPAFGVGCAQAGHFIPGRHNSILFLEHCVHGQCYNCNITLKGNWPGYYAFMRERYGQNGIDEMLRLSKTVRKFTVEELKTMYNRYLNQIELLKSQKKPDILERRRLKNKD